MSVILTAPPVKAVVLLPFRKRPLIISRFNYRERERLVKWGFGVLGFCCFDQVIKSIYIR